MTSLKITICVAVLVVLSIGTVHAQTVLYVDDDASSNGDGASWATAFKYLQDALANADTNGTEIRVAQGTYKPDRDEGGNVARGDREASFQLLNNVALHGGYAGLGAPDPDLRDINSNATILSGDLNGDDDPQWLTDFISCAMSFAPGCETFDLDSNGDVDPRDLMRLLDNGDSQENSHHVVVGIDVDTSALLTGFTLTGGNALDSGSGCGGALYIVGHGTGPTVAECSLVGNMAQIGGAVYANSTIASFTACIFNGNASGAGGGMFITGREGSNPTLKNCTFTRNLSVEGGAIFGSGFHLTDCVLDENIAEGSGGAGYCGTRGSRFDGCTFSNNVAGFDGGGLVLEGWDSTISRCEFIENSASEAGGAVMTTGCSPLGFYTRPLGGSDRANLVGRTSPWGTPFSVTNCTFAGNSASEGGAIRSVAALNLTNSIFTGNTAVEGGGLYASNSCFGLPTTLANCTFSENSAGSEYGGGVRISARRASANNCVFWGNTAASGQGEAAQVYVGSRSPVFRHNCIEGWTGSLGGVGNFGDDPFFLDPDGPDNLLGTLDDDLQLSPGSPCIDVGSNGAVPPDSADLDADGDTAERTPIDLAGNKRFVDDPETPDCPQPEADCGSPPIVDMGAYEYFVDCNSNGTPDTSELGAPLEPDTSLPQLVVVPPGAPMEVSALDIHRTPATPCLRRENDQNGNCVLDECEVMPPDTTCCAPQPEPGCASPVIEACVCSIDPYCCETEWDHTCVAEVTREGCGECDNDCNSNGTPDDSELGQVLPPAGSAAGPAPNQPAPAPLPVASLDVSRRHNPCIRRENDQNGNCVLDECEEGSRSSQVERLQEPGGERVRSGNPVTRTTLKR